MIRYALVCDNGDEFEGWFRNSADYDLQEPELACPVCGVLSVRKAPMAPAVVRRRGEPADPREAAAAFAGQVCQHVRENFEYVGEGFAREARAIHEGQAPERPLWGEASLAEAKALLEEGAPVAPLPPAFAPIPPRKLN